MAAPDLVAFGKEHVSFLRRQAGITVRGRARICAHRGSSDAVQEMLIAIARGSYIRPHRHLGKSESFHVVEGVADVVLFGNGGEILDVVELGDLASGRAFYYRLADGRFHSLVIRTPMFVVHEVTNGPFVPEKTVVASFAPSEKDSADVERYQAEIRRLADRFLG